MKNVKLEERAKKLLTKAVKSYFDLNGNFEVENDFLHNLGLEWDNSAYTWEEMPNTRNLKEDTIFIAFDTDDCKISNTWAYLNEIDTDYSLPNDKDELIDRLYEDFEDTDSPFTKEEIDDDLGEFLDGYDHVVWTSITLDDFVDKLCEDVGTDNPATNILMNCLYQTIDNNYYFFDGLTNGGFSYGHCGNDFINYVDGSKMEISHIENGTCTHTYEDVEGDTEIAEKLIEFMENNEDEYYLCDIFEDAAGNVIEDDDEETDGYWN